MHCVAAGDREIGLPGAEFVRVAMAWATQKGKSAAIVATLQPAMHWAGLGALIAVVLVAAFAYVFATTNFLNLPRLIIENGGCKCVCACHYLFYTENRLISHVAFGRTRETSQLE